MGCTYLYYARLPDSLAVQAWHALIRDPLVRREPPKHLLRQESDDDGMAEKERSELMKVSVLIPPPHTSLPRPTSSFLSFQAHLLLISFTFESRLSLNFLSWKVVWPCVSGCGRGCRRTGEVRSYWV